MPHTPGRWEVDPSDPRFVRRAATEDIGRVGIAGCCVSGLVPYDEAVANALLIASATDLLAACEEALDLSQHADGCGWWDIPPRKLDGSEESQARQKAACDCHLKSLRAAIARATGEDSPCPSPE